MFPESPDCTLYDDTKRNGFWVTGGEPGVIEVLKVWKWPIVHRSKFWPICEPCSEEKIKFPDFYVCPKRVLTFDLIQVWS